MGSNQGTPNYNHLNWLNSLAAATFVINTDHQVIFWNHACEILTDVKAEDVVNTNKHWVGFYDEERPCLADLVLNDDWELNSTLYSHIQKAKSSERGLHAENWCQTPAGYKYLIFEANALFDQNGNLEGSIETLRDASDLKQVEAELQMAQKLEAVGQLAAGIAHEINTPAQYVNDNIRFLTDGFASISSIMSEFTRLLKANINQSVSAELIEKVEGIIEEEDQDYFLEEIPLALKQSQEGIEGISNIVRAMKEFSHPGSEDKQLFDINHIIENTLTVTRNEWKFVAEVDLDLEAPLPPIPCYAQEMGHVFMNLIVNSAHAIADVVDSSANELGKISISSRQHGEIIEIRLSDTGKGIPDAIIDKIFDPFFTTKSVGKGTGQGLSIARSTIKDKHAGTLKVESTEGVGTTFIIGLPVVEADKED